MYRFEFMCIGLKLCVSISSFVYGLSCFLFVGCVLHLWASVVCCLSRGFASVERDISVIVDLTRKHLD